MQRAGVSRPRAPVLAAMIPAWASVCPAFKLSIHLWRFHQVQVSAPFHGAIFGSGLIGDYDFMGAIFGYPKRQLNSDIEAAGHLRPYRGCEFPSCAVRKYRVSSWTHHLDRSRNILASQCGRLSWLASEVQHNYVLGRNRDSRR
jgi:hypothetical protein